MNTIFENKLIIKSEPIPNGWYATDWNGSETHKEIRRDLAEVEIAELRMRDEQAKKNAIEVQNRNLRYQYLNAYRKYQAAVNYGEFECSYEADQFIKRLYDKDWSALDNAPSQIKYFAGEVSYAESGLIRRF